MRFVQVALAVAIASAIASPALTSASAQAPASVDLDSVPAAPGSWSYRAIAGGSEAAFVDASGTQRTIVRCNLAARTVSMVRTGVPAAAPMLSIWTTSASRSVPSRFIATGELIADIAASDPLLDAIAFSRGRFATGAAGAPLLAVPSWPEVVRVVEDCRS